jgi:ATP-dependent helicase IRC3
MRCHWRPRLSPVRPRFVRLARNTSQVSIILRPYQEACLDACANALKSGSTRIGVSLPTGSGKTTVFISLLSRIAPPTPSAVRSLIIVNSIELARQAATQAKQLFPDWSVEIEQGVKHKASGTADVTVATYQTLLQEQRIAKFIPNNMKAIIIDEAHHAAAPSYVMFFGHC